MSKVAWVGAAAFLVIAGQANAQTPPEEDLAGTFFLYSGAPGDMGLPTDDDAKLFLALSGAAAQALFERLGGTGEPRYNENGDEVRERGDLYCFAYAGEEAVQYVCYTGFDLGTGMSISTAIE